MQHDASAALANSLQNLDLYLLNEDTFWYLSDAGGFDNWLAPHASVIAAEVQAVIPPGQNLTYVICETLCGTCVHCYSAGPSLGQPCHQLRPITLLVNHIATLCAAELPCAR